MTCAIVPEVFACPSVLCRGSEWDYIAPCGDAPSGYGWRETGSETETSQSLGKAKKRGACQPSSALHSPALRVGASVPWQAVLGLSWCSCRTHCWATVGLFVGLIVRLLPPQGISCHLRSFGTQNEPVPTPN